MVDPQTIDLATLRQIAILQPESASTRILALLLCAVFLGAVLLLVHRGKLREEYTPIWTIVAVGMMVAILWFDSVRMLTRAVGAWTPSSTLFFFGLVFLLVVSLNYAVRLSGLSMQVKLLAQEVALLRARLADGEAAPGATDDDTAAPS